MKIFLKLLMAVVVLAVMAPFYLKDKQGDALISLNELKIPDLSMPKIPEGVKSMISNISPEELIGSQTSSSKETIEIHKWQDKDGTWHFSSSDNSREGDKSEVVTITLNNKNRYEPMPPPEQKNREAVSGIDVENITPSILLPFTHGKETMDQARQVQKLLEQRSKMHQQMAP